MRLISELRRRNVFKVAVFYAVSAWFVLQVADVLFGLLDVPDWTLKFVFGVLLLGFPFALIFAWVFEMTPDGLKREKDVDRSGVIRTETGRRLTLSITAVLAGGVTLYALDRLVLGEHLSSPAAGQGSGAEAVQPGLAGSNKIAVLPFANLSDDASNEYFSDGMTEELQTLLGQVPDFSVIGRTSAFLFKDQDQDPLAIGRRLGVSHLVQGSVRKPGAGKKVRVSARLIETSTGVQVWSAQYDRDLDDVLAIQENIADAVVSALAKKLLGRDSKRESAVGSDPLAEAGGIFVGLNREVDPAAYESVLKGRYEWHKRTPTSLAAAIDHFQAAIDLDPSYAPAYTGLADAYQLSVDYSDTDQAVANKFSQSAIKAAFALDPNSADAYASLGLLEINRQNNEAAAQALRRAIEVNPNHAMASMWLAITQTNLGDRRAALAAYERARQIDPLHSTILSNLANTLADFGRIDEALAVCDELIELYPKGGRGEENAGLIAWRGGRLDEAAASFITAWRKAPDHINNFNKLPFVMLALNQPELAQAWLDYAVGIAPSDAFIVVTRPAFMRLAGDKQGEIEYWKDLAGRYDNWFFRANLGFAYLLNQDYKASLRHFELGLLREGEETVRITRANADWAAPYAIALRRTGSDDEARRIIDEGLAAFQSLFDTGVQFSGAPLNYQVAALQAQAGDIGESLATARVAAQQGAISSLFWDLNPAFDPIRDDVGFKHLMLELDELMSAQRESLLKAGLLRPPSQLMVAPELDH